MLQSIVAFLFTVFSFFASLIGLDDVPLSSGNSSSDYTVTSSNPPQISPKPGLTPAGAVPASATPATTEQLNDFLASAWKPEPSFQGNTITFSAFSAVNQDRFPDFAGDGRFLVNAPGTCNGAAGAIAVVEPQFKSATLKRIGWLAVTEMACPGLEYETDLSKLFADDLEVRFDGTDTVYLVNSNVALKLNRER